MNAISTPDVSSLAVISESFGLRFEFARKDELTLPAWNPPELRNAEPADRPRVAPVPDPSPGG